jgi:hypothetical protein
MIQARDARCIFLFFMDPPIPKPSIYIVQKDRHSPQKQEVAANSPLIRLFVTVSSQINAGTHQILLPPIDLLE